MRKEPAHNKPYESTGTSIFSLLKPYKGNVSVLVFFALAGNAVNLLIPLIVSQAIDQYSMGNPDLKKVIIQFVGAALLIFLFNYFQGLVQTYTSERAARDMRENLSGKLSRQSFTFINKANPSKLLTNLTSDIDSVKLFISQAFSSILSSLFVIVGASILLISINWRLALTVLAIIPLIGGAFYIMLLKVRPLFKKSREVVDWLNRVINESILGAMLIRILNSQQEEYRKFLLANSTSRDLGLSILSLFAMLIPFITFVSNLAILSILVLGGHFVINGSMTLGEIAAFNNYISILIFPILVIGFMSNMIAHATASYQRILEVLSAPDIPEKGTVVKKLRGKVVFENVSLFYGDKPALKDINIQMQAGSKTAIIGPTAAGKTQLLYLLAGLIKPTSGQIVIDDVPLDDYEKNSLYRQLGIVFQDSVIFNMTVRENITFGNEINQKDLAKAIEAAELTLFTNTLTDQLNTMVSERGTSLSGGQKQRIMLARALALNPALLLLDDFTARVDKRTEQKIMGNIATGYPDLTVITVTQKIAPVEHYEQIILLMEGEVIAAGTHKELLHTSPEYVQIYNSQRSTSHYEVQS
jgi:ATP-binding cassette subfamily B protein